jgi:hypothetical protein
MPKNTLQKKRLCDKVTIEPYEITMDFCNHSGQPPHFGARSAGIFGLSRYERLPRRFCFARAARMARCPGRNTRPRSLLRLRSTTDLWSCGFFELVRFYPACLSAGVPRADR